MKLIRTPVLPPPTHQPPNTHRYTQLALPLPFFHWDIYSFVVHQRDSEAGPDRPGARPKTADTTSREPS